MAAEREAVNMPIQGTAADVLKKAMIDVHAALDERNARPQPARMILTVHDELLFEAPEAEAGAVADLVRDVMERAYAARRAAHRRRRHRPELERSETVGLEEIHHVAHVGHVGGQPAARRRFYRRLRRARRRTTSPL